MVTFRRVKIGVLTFIYSSSDEYEPRRCDDLFGVDAVELSNILNTNVRTIATCFAQYGKALSSLMIEGDDYFSLIVPMEDLHRLERFVKNLVESGDLEDFSR